MSSVSGNRARQNPLVGFGGMWPGYSVSLVVGNTTPLSAPPISAGNYDSGSLSWGLLVGRGDIYFQLYPGGVTTSAACERGRRGKRPTPKLNIEVTKHGINYTTIHHMHHNIIPVLKCTE